MPAVLPEWPIEQPLVVGDDITMTVVINTPDDITGWTFDAAVRTDPEGPVIARWAVSMDAATKTLTLRLPDSESVKVTPGCGFDVRQTSPVDFTWLWVRSLNLLPSYSYEAP